MNFVSALMPWLIGYKVNALPEGIIRKPSESSPETHSDPRLMDVVDEAPARAGTGYENIRLLPILA